MSCSAGNFIFRISTIELSAIYRNSQYKQFDFSDIPQFELSKMHAIIFSLTCRQFDTSEILAIVFFKMLASNYTFHTASNHIFPKGQQLYHTKC